jgi:hypothetical protein
VIVAVLIGSIAIARPLRGGGRTGRRLAGLSSTPNHAEPGELLAACEFAAGETPVLGYEARAEARWRAGRVGRT